MQRIMIIGGPGSGKSTLSQKLGTLLNLPVTHLDRLYWLPGWLERSREDLKCMVQDVAAEERWIIEGNYAITWPARVARAEVIIAFDLPRYLRMWRVLKRSLLYYGRSRPDMADGCKEQFSLEFLLWSWNFDRDIRPKHLRAIEDWRQSSDVRVLRSRRDVDALLQEFEREA